MPRLRHGDTFNETDFKKSVSEGYVFGPSEYDIFSQAMNSRQTDRIWAIRFITSVFTLRRVSSASRRVSAFTEK